MRREDPVANAGERPGQITGDIDSFGSIGPALEGAAAFPGIPLQVFRSVARYRKERSSSGA